MPQTKTRHPLYRLRLDDYSLGDVIGRGTVGTIYAAEENRSGKRVAVKVLLPAMSDNELILARFEREMLILEELNHPNIIRYDGGGKHAGQLFFVMELVTGGSLRKLLDAHQRLGWQAVATIGRQLASALQHAHNHGVIHRDIKPSNILLTLEGMVKLSDFGIAKNADMGELTDTGMTVGSHLYMSPEQINGRRHISGQTDLYSLGCMLFELLTGRPPFQAANFSQLFEQHLKQPPPSICELAPDCPPALQHLIERLLAKLPENRPFNARQVQAEMMKLAETFHDGRASGAPTDDKRSDDKRSNVRSMVDTPASDPVGGGVNEDVAAADVFELGREELIERLQADSGNTQESISLLKIALLLSFAVIAILIAVIVLN